MEPVVHWAWCVSTSVDFTSFLLRFAQFLVVVVKPEDLYQLVVDQKIDPGVIPRGSNSPRK